MKWTWFGWLARRVVAAVFIAAGLSKVIDPAAFADAIGRFALLPESVVPWVAFYLPWLEIVAGVALLWPNTRVSAAWLIGAMLIVMTGALVSAWWRDLNITCGCFGSWWQLSAGWAAVRNVGLMVLLIVSLPSGKGALGSQAHESNRPCDRNLDSTV